MECELFATSMPVIPATLTRPAWRPTCSWRRCSVEHTLERRTRRLAEPKTSSGRRALAPAAAVFAALREHARRQLEERITRGLEWGRRVRVHNTRRASARQPEHHQ